MQNFLLLLICVLELVYGTEIEISTDGFGGSSSSSKSISNTDQRWVTVLNSYDKDVSLYWESNDKQDDKEYFMFTIESNGTLGMNTYNGHRFYSQEVGSVERLPYVIEINEASAFYTIGENGFSTHESINNFKNSEAKQELKSRSSTFNPVTIIGRRTLAMSAKFRCLCSAVDYYYDDGGEGTFQGSLTLGTETTTNSYEGHVFFFTEKGNKQKEIARYTMNQNQVRWVICFQVFTFRRCTTIQLEFMKNL